MFRRRHRRFSFDFGHSAPGGEAAGLQRGFKSGGIRTAQRARAEGYGATRECSPFLRLANTHQNEGFSAPCSPAAPSALALGATEDEAAQSAPKPPRAIVTATARRPIDSGFVSVAGRLASSALCATERETAALDGCLEVFIRSFPSGSLTVSARRRGGRVAKKIGVARSGGTRHRDGRRAPVLLLGRMFQSGCSCG